MLQTDAIRTILAKRVSELETELAALKEEREEWMRQEPVATIFNDCVLLKEFKWPDGTKLYIRSNNDSPS